MEEIPFSYSVFFSSFSLPFSFLCSLIAKPPGNSIKKAAVGAQRQLNTEGSSAKQWSPESGENPTVFFFSLSSHHLAPDVSTTMGSAQKTGVTKANFLARGPRGKSQRTRKYQGYSRERGAWQNGLAPKPVVYKFLGSPLRCPYWIWPKSA